MAQGQIYKGEYLRLRFEGQTLYHATSCSLSVSMSSEELASKDIEGTLISMGNYTATLSTDVLLADKPDGEVVYVDAMDLLEYQLGKVALDWQFTTGKASDLVISGKCYVTQADFTAENKQAATASFSFQVSGKITTERIQN